MVKVKASYTSVTRVICAHVQRRLCHTSMVSNMRLYMHEHG